MKRTIFAEILIIVFSLLDAGSSRAQTPLAPPFPPGTNYHKNIDVNQQGFGIVGCTNLEVILADGSGCSPNLLIPGLYTDGANGINVVGAVNAGSVTSTTPVPVSSGGTGANTAAASLTNLGGQSPNLLHWRSKVACVLAGTCNARACFLGDSTIFGYLSSASNYPAYSMPAAFANDLSLQYGIPAAADSWFGSGTSTPSFGAYDNRIVQGSSWTQDLSVVSLGYGTFKASTATNAFAFTPTGGVDTFRLFYVKQSSGGSLSVNIDGGTATNQSTAGSADVGVLSVTAGSTSIHTLNAYWSSGGAVNIIGTEAYDSTKKSVIVEMAGSNAENSTQAANTSQPYGGGNSAIYSAIGCDLTVLEGGPNDWANLSGGVAAFTTNMNTILTAVKASGSDVAIYTPVPGNPATETTIANQQSYNAVLRTLAASNSNAGTQGVPLPLIDNYTQWQSYATGISNGWYGDTNIHPNAGGGRVNAALVESTVIDQPGQGSTAKAKTGNFQSSAPTDPPVTVTNLSPTGYADIAFQGNGGGVAIGVGNSSEATMGVAGKLFFAVAGTPYLTMDMTGNFVSHNWRLDSIVVPFINGETGFSVVSGAGAGTSPSAPGCAASYTCNSLHGMISMTMGTATPATGIVVTITPGTNNGVRKDCMVTAYDQTASTSTPLFAPTASNTTIAAQAPNVAMGATHPYYIEYQCFN